LSVRRNHPPFASSVGYITSVPIYDTAIAGEFQTGRD
jgi:hypothetical protein